MATTALIVDDEAQCRDTLSSLLAERHPNIHVIGIANDVPSGTALALAHMPDLLFLDVVMGRMTGFDLLKAIAPHRPHVIFTTAHEGYAVRAIRFNAVDYLLKPVVPEELDDAIHRALIALGGTKSPADVTSLLHQVANDRQIALPTSEGLTMVQIEEILYCSSDNNYTEVYLRDEKGGVDGGAGAALGRGIPDPRSRLPNSHLWILESVYVMRFVETNRNSVNPTHIKRETMKTLTTFLTGALMLANITTHARIIRVNSVAAFATTCTDCYQTLDDDTIHLEPADANYGDLTIQKRLVIIGAGYKLGAAPNNIGLQANSQTSKVNLLTLNNINSQGTVIMGLHFVDQFGGVTIANTSDITVSRCYFNSSLDIVFPNGGTGVSNILVAENFISGSITLLSTGNHALKNAEVAYNVFYGNIAGSNNTVHDNISATSLVGGDASNQVVNMGNVYNLLVGTDDSKYDILAASPYNEGGAQGRGAFSGISPYRLSGIPNIPTIYSLQSTLNTTPGGTVNVTLSTKSNN